MNVSAPGTNVWIGETNLLQPFSYENEDLNVIIFGNIVSKHDIIFKVKNLFLNAEIVSTGKIILQATENVFHCGLIKENTFYFPSGDTPHPSTPPNFAIITAGKGVYYDPFNPIEPNNDEMRKIRDETIVKIQSLNIKILKTNGGYQIHKPYLALAFYQDVPIYLQLISPSITIEDGKKDN